MSPAPTARARPSRSCARCWKRRARGCTSIPRRISCGSTSASASAAPAAGSLVGNDELAEALAVCERANGDAPITVFEMETAAGFLLFSRHPADALLLEVGLGGRLDATNVVALPLASVITPVSMDHVEFLGDTLEKITGEKAAIFKRGVPAVVGRQTEGPLSVIVRARRRDRRAAPRRRPGLDRERGARPARLSGRAGPARPAEPAPVRPPPDRQCRHRDRGAARGGVQAAAGGL